MATLYDAEGNEIEVPDDVLNGGDGATTGGPKQLREHAKNLDADLKAERERAAERDAKLAAYERRDKFNQLIAEHKIEGLTVEDLGDVSPEELTPTLLKVKATEKQEAAIVAMAQQAKTAGFVDANGQPDVEGYKEALAAAKAQREANTQAQTAGAASARLGTTPTPPETPTPNKMAEDAFVAARESGAPLEHARAAYIETLLNPPAPKTPAGT